jgi:hypothetical protein
MTILEFYKIIIWKIGILEKIMFYIKFLYNFIIIRKYNYNKYY